LSKAPERALVTDDMATTAANSCEGLMLATSIYCGGEWVWKKQGPIGLRMKRGEDGRITSWGL
jgi:hypothetical protein